ncbi:unnamed protein product [Rotaria magnacalcarata]|uniref:Uncharacterized protein n=1 Tax=Rotaria magnacalcarata TaxID=392030 RepID=A0A816LQ04_9BILA|nr:unnamed protein product [Rotaria magnacalcarata]
MGNEQSSSPQQGSSNTEPNYPLGGRHSDVFVLNNGPVFVTGGSSYYSYLDSTELYDPSAGLWTMTNIMENPRYAHTASLLTKGKILVTGGWGGTSYLNSAELYDISVGNWATTGNMNIARECHTSSVLPNGNVLVTGGLNFIPLNRSELY